MFAIKLAFAGLGHFIAHWSIGIIIIAICVAGEIFIGWVVAEVPFLQPFTKRIQTGLLIVAVATALVLFGEWLGARDMASRCDARAAVIQTTVDKAVKGTDTPGAQRSGDPWDTGN